MTAVVVLGKALVNKCEPSDILIGRMKVASEEFLKKGNKEGDVMIVTGGLLQNCTVSEAAVMKGLAIQNGNLRSSQ